MTDRRIFTEAVVGEALEPVTIEVSEENVRRYLQWSDRPNAWWVEGAFRGEALVPPGVLEGAGMMALAHSFVIGSGVNTNVSYRCHRPLRIGERMTARAKVADQYERRGRSYLVVETDLYDEQGAIAFQTQVTLFQLPADIDPAARSEPGRGMLDSGAEG